MPQMVASKCKIHCSSKGLVTENSWPNMILGGKRVGMGRVGGEGRGGVQQGTFR